jgi:hypothetical protein
LFPRPYHLSTRLPGGSGGLSTAAVETYKDQRLGPGGKTEVTCNEDCRCANGIKVVRGVS